MQLNWSHIYPCILLTQICGVLQNKIGKLNVTMTGDIKKTKYNEMELHADVNLSENNSNNNDVNLETLTQTVVKSE